MFDTYTPNGYHCLGSAGHFFGAADAVEHEVIVYQPGMHDRGYSPVTCIEVHCPHCGEFAEPASVCDECHAAPPALGDDYCAQCTLIVEQREHEAHMQRCRENRHEDLTRELFEILGVEA